MSAEIWKPVVGFEGQFEVSNRGRVRGLDRHISFYQKLRNGETRYVTQHRKGQMLKPGRASTGYLTVNLTGQQNKQVHVLVLEAFVGPRPPGMEACHFDDNRVNNNLINLRWGTPSENRYDAVRNGGLPFGDNHYNRTLSSRDIPTIRRRIKSEPQWRVAQEYGVHQVTISKIKRGLLWKSA